MKIQDVLEDTLRQICDNYCKYPEMPIPEGKDEDWLCDDDGPCTNCPLNKLI